MMEKQNYEVNIYYSFLNNICIFGRVSEALIFGSWMLGQALAFVPNYSIAKMAAGRMFHLMDRKPQIYSPQITGSSDLVSGIFNKYHTMNFQ
jgi:hypothetical protein